MQVLSSWTGGCRMTNFHRWRQAPLFSWAQKSANTRPAGPGHHSSWLEVLASCDSNFNLNIFTPLVFFSCISLKKFYFCNFTWNRGKLWPLTIVLLQHAADEMQKTGMNAFNIPKFCCTTCLSSLYQVHFYFRIGNWQRNQYFFFMHFVHNIPELPS